MITLAVDLGGSHASCAVLVDGVIRSSKMISAVTERVPGFESLLKEITRCLRSICYTLGVETTSADGLVFGFPGVVSPDGSTVTETNEKFDEARQFDFASWARKQLGVRCILENDARLALMGEHYRGAAAGFEDAALITLGTGIGTAVIIDGKIFRGGSGRTGCLGGHIPVVLGGRKCTCGNVGCAESESSTWALQAIAKTIPGYLQSPLSTHETLDFSTVFAYADEGDTVASSLLDRCFQVWSALAVAVFHAYSPAVLLFGGGVMARGNDILPVIRQHVTDHAWGANGSAVRAAALGSDAALYGAVPRLLEARA